MDKKIIFTAMYQKFISYFKSETFKQAFLNALNTFKNALWNNVKNEVKRIMSELITDIEKYVLSDQAKEKEELILDKIMEQLELPILLKPFRGFIRKVIKSRFEELIIETINKSKEIVS